MQVNPGAPNAEYLKNDDLLFIAVRGQWYTSKVVIGAFTGSITFQVVNRNMPNYPIELIDKWAHCEGPNRISGGVIKTLKRMARYVFPVAMLMIWCSFCIATTVALAIKL